MTENHENYFRLLRRELVPAMGCTEPIALAFAAAHCRELLGKNPDRINVFASGGIIKNAKSVVVPNTNGLKGIKASIAAGIIAGVSDKKLQVISVVTQEQKVKIADYLENTNITVEHLKENPGFQIIVVGYTGSKYVKIETSEYHTNIVHIEKNGEVLFSNYKSKDDKEKSESNYLDIGAIWTFASSCDINIIKDLLQDQIYYNMAIASEGLKREHGANIGKVMMNSDDDSIANRVAAIAAAASDARMNGCEIPVIINSGSGNQGIACSVPVIEYASIMNIDEERLMRALLLSNLLTIYQKQGIGTLSAFCGVVCAGAAAGAGIAYLKNASKDDVENTLVNALAIVSGIICDGAKPSCAAKIAFSVKAGIMGYDMCRNGQRFLDGDGIVAKKADDTIRNVCRLGKDGMQITNDVIINIMIEE